jgi:hypothetical protein
MSETERLWADRRQRVRPETSVFFSGDEPIFQFHFSKSFDFLKEGDKKNILQDGEELMSNDVSFSEFYP